MQDSTKCISSFSSHHQLMLPIEANVNYLTGKKEVDDALIAIFSDLKVLLLVFRSNWSRAHVDMAKAHLKKTV